jgi:hypothetical protein
MSLPTLRLGVGAGAGDQGMFGCQAPGSNPHVPVLLSLAGVVLLLLPLCGSMNDVGAALLCCDGQSDKLQTEPIGVGLPSPESLSRGDSHQMPFPGNAI